MSSLYKPKGGDDFDDILNNNAHDASAVDKKDDKNKKFEKYMKKPEPIKKPIWMEPKS